MSVLIIGLMPGPFQAVKRAFPAMDLRLWTTGSSEQQVSKSAGHADRVVAMASFIAHKHLQRIDKRKLVLVHGGVTSLRAALAHIEESKP